MQGWQRNNRESEDEAAEIPKRTAESVGKKTTSHTGQRKEVGQIYDTSVQARQSPQSFFIHLMYNYLFVLVVSRSS